MTAPSPLYDLRPGPPAAVAALCASHHAYRSAGRVAVYSLGVVEAGAVVAGWLWQPPAPGSARAVCPEEPAGVLALSRMVAVPREARRLRHISRPLRRMMRCWRDDVALIDRSRWPVLVTYSDESVGHTGHVYLCSGWERTTREQVPVYEDAAGRRVSRYSGGATSTAGLRYVGHAWLQRWEHWVCERGEAAQWMAAAGWQRVPLAGRVWRSGAQAHTWRRCDGAQLGLAL